VSSFARRYRAGGDFASQHRNIEEREVYLSSGVRRSAKINRALSPLDRLYRRRDKTGASLLNEAEYEAGQRFAQDYAMAHYDHIPTQNYMSAGADSAKTYTGRVDHIDRQIDVRKRLENAKAIIAICCFEKSLEQVERAEKWAASSGLTILKMGLSALADHYGTRAGPVRGKIKI